MVPDNTTFDYQALSQALSAIDDLQELYQAIVNAPFDSTVEAAFLFLGFICIYIVDADRQALALTGASNTEHYDLSVRDIEFDPDEYHIPLTDTANSIVQAIATGKPVVTTDWGTLSRLKSSQESARLNQASSGIAHSVVYPLQDSKGALMYNYFQYQEQMGHQQQDFMERYTKLVSDRLAGAAMINR